MGLPHDAVRGVRSCDVQSKRGRGQYTYAPCSVWMSKACSWIWGGGAAELKGEEGMWGRGGGRQTQYGVGLVQTRLGCRCSGQGVTGLVCVRAYSPFTLSLLCAILSLLSCVDVSPHISAHPIQPPYPPTRSTLVYAQSRTHPLSLSTPHYYRCTYPLSLSTPHFYRCTCSAGTSN